MSEDIEKKCDKQKLEKVKKRREELVEEWGEDEYDEIEVNDILRDEFSEGYENELIYLGINDDEEELGLEEMDDDDKVGDLDDEDKQNLVKSMLDGERHVIDTEMRLRGYDKVGKKYVKRRAYLIPPSDVDFVVQLLEVLFSPQSLASKLHTNLRYFDDTMNTLVNNFRARIDSYPDHVVSSKDMRKAIDLLLSEISVVRSAIATGRLGDITRDMAIDSYNEKQDYSTEDKISDLQRKLKMN